MTPQFQSKAKNAVAAGLNATREQIDADPTIVSNLSPSITIKKPYDFIVSINKKMKVFLTLDALMDQRSRSVTGLLQIISEAPRKPSGEFARANVKNPQSMTDHALAAITEVLRIDPNVITRNTRIFADLRADEINEMEIITELLENQSLNIVDDQVRNDNFSHIETVGDLIEILKPNIAQPV